MSQDEVFVDEDAPAEAVDRVTNLTFPAGILGFDGITEWSLIVNSATPTIGDLRASDELGLLVTTDPFLCAPNYEPDLPDADIKTIGIERREQVALLAVMRYDVDAQGSCAFINLQAPIVINIDTGHAIQVILDRQGWPRQHRVGLDG